MFFCQILRLSCWNAKFIFLDRVSCAGIHTGLLTDVDSVGLKLELSVLNKIFSSGSELSSRLENLVYFESDSSNAAFDAAFFYS